MENNQKYALLLASATLEQTQFLYENAILPATVECNDGEFDFHNELGMNFVAAGSGRIDVDALNDISHVMFGDGEIKGVAGFEKNDNFKRIIKFTDGQELDIDSAIDNICANRSSKSM